jgi:hypothetical protein
MAMISVKTAPQLRIEPKHEYSGRSLHLIDVENLAGRTSFREVDVAVIAAAYEPVASIGPDDLVVVASSHFTAAQTWFGWGSARRLVRSGPDGADLALIEVIETEKIATRFGRVVIASGDRIFAEPAAWLQAQDVDVTVVTRADALSNQVRLAVRDIRFLDVLPQLAPDIAQRAA